MTPTETIADLENKMAFAQLDENVAQIIMALRLVQAAAGWSSQATSIAYALLAGRLIAESVPPAMAERFLEEQITFMRAGFAGALP